MFNGYCGEVRVRHEVCLDAWCFKEFPKNFAMAIRGFRDPHGIAAKPREYLPPCVGYGRGPLEHTWIGGHAQESQQARPRQADRRRAIQPFIEPRAGTLVLGEDADVRVDQQIGVDQNYLKRSPSATAITSVTLSMLPTRHRPKDSVRVRKGSRGAAGGPAIRPKPRRRASFTTAFRLALRALRSGSSAMATSFSRVRVVLMHQSVKEVMS